MTHNETIDHSIIESENAATVVNENGPQQLSTEPVGPAESETGSQDAHAEYNSHHSGAEASATDVSAELKAALESLLFVSAEPLSIDRLVGVMENASKSELLNALRTLQADYAAPGRGLQLVEVAGGFQITTRVECAPWIKRLEKVKAGAKLSRSAMETLAIVAYKQPLVRAEIEQIRGVDTAGVLRTLLDRRLLRIVGRKDIPGRPIMYGTTRQFLQSFGLKDLADLPALRDIRELGEPEHASLEVLEEMSEETGDHPSADNRDESNEKSSMMTYESVNAM